MITLPRVAAMDTAHARLEAKLEQEYEGHTQALAALLARRRRRPSADLEAASVGIRQSISDVAQALRRMAEGSYGTCEQCAGDIELDHLEDQPAARYCRACTPSTAA